MTIKLTKKQITNLTTAYEMQGHKNGYQALKAQLSPANKAKLRTQCDTTDFISDRDLIYSIIDRIGTGDSQGLDI